MMTTNVFAMIECLKLIGMLTQVPPCPGQPFDS